MVQSSIKNMRAFDRANNRLIYFNKTATSVYWDDLWSSFDLKNQFFPNCGKTEVKITKRYLPLNSRILEGGCGLGTKVYALHSAGFRVTGIDFAECTVDTVKHIMPQLDIRLGDVRRLDFNDDTFCGYWSLGVIEHFWDGYSTIIKEAYRVLRPGGYFFLTFPQMSIVRKIKVICGLYKEFKENGNKEQPIDFYQFALEPENVTKELKDAGFEIVKKWSHSGFKGFKDEIDFLRPYLIYLNDRSHKLPVKIINKSIDFLVRRICGHMCLLISKKTDEIK